MSNQICAVKTEVSSVKTQMQAMQKDIRSTATSSGALLEFASSGVIDKQFGASLGAPCALRSAEDVAAVVSPVGRPIVPSTTQLVAALAGEDLGFWHLASCGVRHVQDLASGKGPTAAVVAVANELQAMRAYEQLAVAAAAATSALETSAAAGGGGGPGGAAAVAAAVAAARVPEAACMAVVRQLHRSGVGSGMFAADLERYLLSSPEQRAELLAGHMFVPCLSAVATGTALPELQVDRCGRVALEEQVSGAIAVLHIGELKLASAGVRVARKQVVRSATALAWAYHALRSGADSAAALPLVLDVRAHVFTSKDGRSHSRQASRQLPAYHRVERLPGHGCPLTIDLSYYTLTPSAAKRWDL
ncbi:hypothetical protein HXX76_007975 [Chlamydomonas incerta]|uniref:Uncharacterized protein n=1 Tax=Chlamydomonas incerta TaxID=51695 RepID=A0A835T894_CHLIN|nr:hypothetical protein HXX76_007975 [Chlamydomonas incerta]|eukprot:KAG2434250.1 hypothetical protein HXX76_007975 [Chlamydomonas incerta]